jgi:hypothetical protein
MDMFDSRADISKSKYPLKKPKKKNESIRKENSQRESEAEVVTPLDPTVEVTPTLQ